LFGGVLLARFKIKKENRAEFLVLPTLSLFGGCGDGFKMNLKKLSLLRFQT
jgi:hypothetical protein